MLMSAVLKQAPLKGSGKGFDQAAICVSAACLVHCLVVPALLVVAPWLSLGFLGEEWFHLTMVLLIVPLSLVGFRLGYRRHGNRTALKPGFFGLALIVLAAVFEATHIVSHTVAAVLTSIGGIALIVAHWRNLKPCRCTLARPEHVSS